MNSIFCVKNKQNCESDLLNSNTYLLRQTVAATGTALLTLSVGFSLGYSAILLPQLKHDNDIIINDEISSWIASIAPLSMCIGCAVAGYITDGLGRRNSQMFLTIPFLIGCLLMAFATNTNILLIGRFIASLASGAIRPLAGVFLGEMSTPKYRGYFLFGSTLSMNLGILVSHLLGTYLNWRLTAGLCTIPPLAGFLIMTRLPESPIWLINKRRNQEAEVAYVWYRGTSEIAKQELKSTVEKQAIKLDNLTFKKKISIVFSKEFMTPFLTSFILFITVQFCGINIIPFYATDILDKAVGDIDPYASMIAMDFISVLASGTLVVFAKTIPRKKTFLVCCFGTSIVLFLHVTFSLINPTGFTWLPLVLMIVYAYFASSGIITLSWSFLAEIFPARLRGLGSGVGASITYAILFICVKVTPNILFNYGQITLFLIFAIVTFVCGCVLCYLLPETQGKTLQEIEDGYDKK